MDDVTPTPGLHKRTLSGDERWYLVGPWRAEFTEIIRRSSVRHLELNHALGSKVKDLTFLPDLGLRSLTLLTLDLDVSPVEECRSLVELNVSHFVRGGIDFSRLSSLARVGMDFVPGRESVFDLKNLIRLGIAQYPHVDMSPLSHMTDLRELSMGPTSKLQSLRGAEVLRALTDLTLGFCTNLRSLAGIGECSALKRLSIDTCKRIDSYDPVGELRLLEHLEIFNSAPIASLRVFAGLHHLTSIGFAQTTVEDGDVLVLETLPSLQEALFDNKRVYNAKQPDLRLRGAATAGG